MKDYSNTPEVIPIIKQEEGFLYINRTDCSPTNLIALQDRVKAEELTLMDAVTNEKLRIRFTPNAGLTIGVFGKRRMVSADEIIKIIKKMSFPTPTKIANVLGIRYNAIKKYMELYKLYPAMEEQRKQSVEMIEDTLVSLAKDGNLKAIETFLSANYPEKYGKTRTAVTSDISVKIQFDEPPRAE